MSEASAGDDIHYQCLLPIMQSCIGSDVEKVKELMNYLRDDDIINREQRGGISALLKEKQCNSAIEQMMIFASKSDRGLQYFISASRYEEIKLDEKVSELIAVVLEKNRLDANQILLVTEWNQLVSREEDMKAMVKDIWKEDSHEEILTQWPLYFIHFCLTGTECKQENLDEFLIITEFLKKPPKDTTKEKDEQKSTRDILQPPHSDRSNLQEPEKAYIISNSESAALQTDADKLLEERVEGAASSDSDSGSESSDSENDTVLSTTDSGTSGKTPVLDETSPSNAAWLMDKLQQTAKQLIGRGRKVQGSAESESERQSVEFRVFIKKGKRKLKWFPVLQLFETQHPLKKHRLGYYHTKIPITSDSLSYCYVIKKDSKIRTEYLPDDEKDKTRERAVLPDHLVVHDAAVFKRSKKSREKWEGIVNSYARKYLLGAKEDDIFYWITSMLTGWQTSSKYSYCLKKQDVDEALIEWLNSAVNNPSAGVHKRSATILVSLTIAWTLCQLHDSIDNIELLNKICEGLQMHNLDEESQRRLYPDILKAFQPWEGGIQSAEKCLKFIFKSAMAINEVKCILALPLYWFIADQGAISRHYKRSSTNFQIGKPMLPNIDKQNFWEDFRERVSDEDGLRKLRKLQNWAVSAWKMHPWIADVYCFFLPASSVIEMIWKGDGLRDILKIDFILNENLPHILKRESQETLLSGHQEVIAKDYIKKRIQHLKDPTRCGSLSHEDRLNEKQSANFSLNFLIEALENVSTQTSREKQENVEFFAAKRHILRWLLPIILDAVYWLKELMKANQEDDEAQKKELKPYVGKTLDVISRSFGELASFEFSRRLDVDEIDLFNHLFAMKWPHTEFQQDWEKTVSKDIEFLVNEVWKDQTEEPEFLRFYFCDLKNTNICKELDLIMQAKVQYIFKCLTGPIDKGWKALVKKISKIVHDSEDEANKLLTALGEIFVQEYEKIPRRENEKPRIRELRFLLTSSYPCRFYGAIGPQDSEIMSKFSANARGVVVQVTRVFRELIEQAKGEKITVEELRMLLQNNERVLDLVQLFEHRKDTVKHNPVLASKVLPSKEYKLLLHMYRERLEEYDKHMEALQYFIDHCKSFQQEVDCDQLEKLMQRKPKNVTENELSTQIPKKQLPDILLFVHLKHSQLLRNICKIVTDYLQSYQRTAILYTDILNDWWGLCKFRISTFRGWLDEGNEDQNRTEEMTRVLDFTNGEPEVIEKELVHVYTFSFAVEHKEDTRDQIQNKANERSVWLSKVFEIQKYQGTINWMTAFIGKYAINGGFMATQLSNFYSLSEEKFETVKNISKHLKILQDFSSQIQLIEWLQTMKDEGDVRGLCMLAKESCRSEPVNADRWSCLSDVVTGFGELIFYLDEICRLEDFLIRCKEVVEKVASDSDLLTNWTAAGKEVEWYKQREQLYGKEEQNALQFAERVNKYGVYTVGKCRIDGSEPATLDNSIILNLSDASSTEAKDLEYLYGIESQLMLISGDGEDAQKHIRQFVEVLNAIKVLATAYINLVDEGFMLFTDWRAVVGCKESKDRNMLMEHMLTLTISFKNGTQSLSKTACINDIQTLAGILRHSLKMWGRHIGAMRLRHYFLNDYSIQQIRYLCEELGKFKKIPPKQEVQVLLPDLPPEQVTRLIEECLEDAIQVDEQDDDMGINDASDNGQGEHVSEEVLKRRTKKQVVRKLVNDENVPEQLAKAAVQFNGESDLDECTTWMLLNHYETDMIEKFSEAFDQETGFVSDDQSDIQEDTSLLRSKSAKTLEALINSLQDGIKNLNILVEVKTICMAYLEKTAAMTLKDHLSINHLGNFLTLLHNKIAKEHVLKRDVGNGLKKGQPNLLLCEPHSIMPLLLSLYVGKEYSKQDAPLPTHSEVLMCSERTTMDEVERFVYRALCLHPNGACPIFCLAYADKLDFHASRAVESIFTALSHDRKHCREDYQLIVILSDRLHYISACFDKYQIENLPEHDKNEVQTHFHKQMTVETCLGERKAEVVMSARCSVGKSLYVRRKIDQCQLVKGEVKTTTLRLLEKRIDVDKVLDRLYKNGRKNSEAQLIHIDLSPAVEEGIEKFIFELVVLGMITGSSGKAWRRHKDHSYVIEITRRKNWSLFVLELLPYTECLSPKEVLPYLQQYYVAQNIVLMDNEESQSLVYQRSCQYLSRLKNDKDIVNFTYKHGEISKEASQAECIELLLHYCGIEDPSWAQLKYFASFLDAQIANCEKSGFCRDKIQTEDCQEVYELVGLKKLAVKFMIRMSQDFATPSLENCVSTENAEQGTAWEQHQIRRRWEDNEHPYIFFNDDGETMSFINVHINENGDLLNKHCAVVEEGITTSSLVKGLKIQGYTLKHDFDCKSRGEMLSTLRRIMGIESQNPNSNESDPDSTYELTTDNVLKMIAIHMRFKCGIPVILMGETGCGKTRLIEFMSKLGSVDAAENMENLRVHGGIEIHDIFESVRRAHGEEASGGAMTAVECTSKKILFYDEANTTNAIYAIKEVMCDMTVDGEPYNASNFRIVAACNPYKQLSPEAVQKLESSGLGYRVPTKETSAKMDHVAMRTLVYKVVPLPPSIRTFVWDFGQLSDETEKMYIGRLVSKLEKRENLSTKEKKEIITVLSSAQTYTRQQTDESRYVSLRDVERSIILYQWFMAHKVVFEIADQISKYETNLGISESLRCLLHAVGVNYHASLVERKAFRERISQELTKNHGIQISEKDINNDYISCQAAFFSHLKVDDNIAWNEALRENVFLMVVCTDAKLPLYIIGKPGSSKSLAKAIVEANMTGSSASSKLFRHLSKVDVLSYQCSAITQPSGIKEIFDDAAKRQQKSKNFTALVALDEVGLAEDSPHMPLKVLHSLLERRWTDAASKHSDKDTHVAFVGISNWALDPAKMNRGIFVTRDKPDKKDLIETAKGIMQSKNTTVDVKPSLLEKLTNAYVDIYENQDDQFFGLRDYYSLIKMVYALVKNGNAIDNKNTSKLLLRNFSGGNEKHFAALEKAASKHLSLQQEFLHEASVRELVNDNMSLSENRYLLLLANQYSAVSLLRHVIPSQYQKLEIIFGSSFSGDHTYTEICRNINRIKLCMEAGSTVVLLNMREIHESLYDVLNQHYIRFGDNKYAALGLGKHRAWSRVHKDFRVIIIENKDVVHNYYPIPLVNRLEKHHLLCRRLLSENQVAEAESLEIWCSKFAEVDKFRKNDAFLGYHEDTVNSVVLEYGDESTSSYEEVMLQVATADSIYRLDRASLGRGKELLDIYMQHQTHDCLLHLLQASIKLSSKKVKIFEIFSFSNILTEDNRKQLEERLNLAKNSIMLLSLQQFKFLQEYTKKLDDFFKRCKKGVDVTPGQQSMAILLIQTPQAHNNGHLIECAKHHFFNKLTEISDDEISTTKVIVGFVLSTERRIQRCSSTPYLILQHDKKIDSLYIDELRHCESNCSTSLISSYYDKNLKDILDDGIKDLGDGEGKVPFVIILLQDCICEAMSKVTNAENGDKRQIDRISILRQLCDISNAKFKCAGSGFLKILFDKMGGFQFAINPDKKEWIVTEASSLKRLQEGGTFGKTIHLRLKRLIADMFAYIISVIDENNNLSIVLDSKENTQWKIEVWLKLFKAIIIQEAEARTSQYIIRSSKSSCFGRSCDFPFSFAIIAEMELVYETCSASSESKEETFYSLITNTKNPQLLKLLELLDGSNCVEMMRAYANDVIKFLLGQEVNDQDQLNRLAEILFEFSKQKWLAWQKKFSALAVVFFGFMEVHEHLKLALSIFKIYPESMLHVRGWLKDWNKSNSSEFSIHHVALEHMLNWAKNNATEMDDKDSCVGWMANLYHVKKTYYEYIDLVILGPKKEGLQKIWKPLALLDMLLLHLLPPKTNTLEYDRYVRIFVSQAKRLLKGVQKMGLESLNVLKITAGILRTCYEDLKLNLLIKWKKTACKSCGRKIQKPMQMPCGGISCGDCARLTSTSISNTCPICNTILSSSFEPTPPVLSVDAEDTLKKFKSDCTSFFLEYLENFAFKCKNEEPMCTQSKMRSLLLNIVAPGETPNDLKLETQALNLDIATRSNVLRLLLNLDENFVKVSIDKTLQDYGLQDKCFLTTVLNAFENNYSSKDAGLPEEVVTDSSAKMLQTSWTSIVYNKHLKSESLKQVAATKHALTNFVHCIQKANKKDDQKKIFSPAVVIYAIDMLKTEESEVPQKFVIQTGMQLYGSHWLSRINGDQRLKQMVPQNALQKMNEEENDHWEILGEEYKHLKTELARESSWRTANHWLPKDEELMTMKNLTKLLAILQRQDNNITAALKQRATAESPECHLFIECSHLVEILTSKLGVPSQLGYAIYQAVMLFVGLSTCRLFLLENFFCMISNPRSLAYSYWPAMPRSLYHDVGDTMQDGEVAFTCPNGHVYYIGECIKPMEEAKCADCGADIGGKDHRFVAGNDRICISRKAELGYQLHKVRRGVDNPADRITQHGAAILEFMIHSCLLAATKANQSVVRSMTGVDTDDQVYEFLFEKLWNNLEAVSCGLGCSVDHGILVLHQTFARMMTIAKDNTESGHEGLDWSDGEKCRRWELEFYKHYLLPTLEDVNVSLLEAQRKLKKLTTFDSYLRQNENCDGEQPTCLHPVLWKPIKHLSVPHLLHFIADSSSSGGIFKTILQTPNLHLVKDLIKVLECQKMMMRKCHNKYDLDQVETITIEEARGNYTYKDASLINDYIKIWNKVYPMLKNLNLSDSTLTARIDEISEKSPISVTLPSFRRLGKCAKLLAEYLIDIHNNFLEKCSEFSESQEKIPDVEVFKLLPSYLVTIDIQKDLWPMIALHSQYTTENENGYHISYNIGALEKQAREKYVMYKRRIRKETLPCVKYAQDIGIGPDWKGVKNNTQQVPLSRELSQEVENAMRNSTLADVCEGVRTLTQAISFLGKIPCDENRILRDYLAKDLTLSPTNFASVPKSARICHTLALYQKLSCHKAVCFVMQGLDPYKEALCEGTQEDIEDRKLLNKLKISLEHTDLKSLQEHINEMLIKINGLLYHSDWKLVDIFSELNFIEENPNDSWYSAIPKEVLFKHLSHLFRLSVEALSNYQE